MLDAIDTEAEALGRRTRKAARSGWMNTMQHFNAVMFY
jgi:hypothetical protein